MPRQKKQTFQVPPTPRSPVPMTVPRPIPPPKLWHQSQPTGFFSILKEGMAFGAGSEIAHTAIRSLLGTTPKKTEYELCVEQATNTKDECREMYAK